MTKKTQLSTSTLVERKLTENQYDMVDTEEEMSFVDLTITGNYSDYYFLEKLLPKTIMFGSKPKKKYEGRE